MAGVVALKIVLLLMIMVLQQIVVVNGLASRFYGIGSKPISGDTFECEKGDSDESETVLVKVLGIKAPSLGE